jgi:1,2-diacylglycerol 3-alpha-glucosyltransferase
LTRLAFIVHRMGPYHAARLRAASRRGALFVVELSGKDRTYAWDMVRTGSEFERVTMFKESDALDELPAIVRERMRAVLAEQRPDVVAVPGWSEPAALAALEWCTQRGVPTILLSESQRIDKPRSPWKEALKSQIVRLYSAAFVGGQPNRDYIVDLGMPRSRVSLGYDAVENDHFREGAEAAKNDAYRLRALHGLPDRYFLACARFVAEKNLAVLIAAYARYVKHCTVANQSAWQLVLIGDGEDRAMLHALRRSHGLESHLHMPGFVQYEQLPIYYGLASAFVHASSSEPWGLVVNEAMAAGLPVFVSNKCGCARDLLRDGRNGVSFDPADVSALADLFRRASGGQIDLERMGMESRTIIADWGPDRFADGLWTAVDLATAARGAGDSMLRSAVLKTAATYSRLAAISHRFSSRLRCSGTRMRYQPFLTIRVR